jgi:hypothetical protein
MTSLFDRIPRLDDSKLHPLFLLIRDSRSHVAARGLMDRVFGEYIDKDNSFAREFQTQGFSARVWELSLFGYTGEQGYALDNAHQMPDFILPDICTIEAATNQPSIPMSPPKADLSTEQGRLHHFTINASDRIPEFRQQLRKAITTKARKRFADGSAYWDLPHVRDLPFVIAVQSFYAETATAFTDAIAAMYLLGDETGETGLFVDPSLTPISAVLFSNSGTVGQFNRIGKQLGYGVDDVHIWRVGFCWNPDESAVSPLEFGYEVGAANAPPESFGQSLHLIHNPNADHPLPSSALTGIRQTAWTPDRRQLVTIGAEGFVPFGSHTVVLEINDTSMGNPTA